MTDKIGLRHFLLVFDHRKGELIDLQAFEDRSNDAVDAYSAKELEYREMPWIDIVLVGSDSVETVKLTHANYFDGSAAVSHFLSGV